LLFDQADFNDAGAYFAGRGAAEWADLEVCIESLPLYLQPSGQRAKVGQPIFDPKATNAYLTNESHGRGWRKVPVPAGLTEFGTDWDAGKHETLAEWQFSNYPFLWNNVIRSEAVFKGETRLQGMMPIAALVVVTKSGMLPASNSTLYFEQARAQLNAVTTFGAFDLPIRLVVLGSRPRRKPFRLFGPLIRAAMAGREPPLTRSSTCRGASQANTEYHLLGLLARN
jgi:hypothetical protein